jgi:hypothetical protein
MRAWLKIMVYTVHYTDVQLLLKIKPCQQAGRFQWFDLLLLHTVYGLARVSL